MTIKRKLKTAALAVATAPLGVALTAVFLVLIWLDRYEHPRSR